MFSSMFVKDRNSERQAPNNISFLMSRHIAIRHVAICHIVVNFTEAQLVINVPVTGSTDSYMHIQFPTCWQG